MNTAPDASTTPGATGPVLRVVLLLERPPAGVATVLQPLVPDIAAQIAGAPLNRLTVNINGVPLAFEVATEPLVARELDYAVAQSPLRDLVQAAVARHGGYLVLSAQSGADLLGAGELLAKLAARYANDDNALAVWLPDADRATTGVMYGGEALQRPAQVLFNTMGARLDEASAIAHTIGVRHLGGAEVQLRTAALGPADAFRELRGAVATLLEARTLPSPGLVVTIAGAPHVLTSAVSVLRMGDVLEAVPVAAERSRR